MSPVVIFHQYLPMSEVCDLQPATFPKI